MAEKGIQTKPDYMVQDEQIELLKKRIACANIVISIMRQADTVMRKETGRFVVKGYE